MRTRMMRAKVVVIALLMILSAHRAAFSDVFFTAYDSGKNASTIGNVSIKSGAFVVNKKSTEAGARVFGYNSGSRLLLTIPDPTGDDTAFIYKSANVSEVLSQTKWPHVRDIFDASYLRGYLYVACRGSSNIVKIDTNFNTRKEIDWVYPQRGAVPHLPEGYVAKAVSVAILGDEIYGLFTISNSQGEYRDSILVKLADDITTLRTLSYAAVVPDATAVFVLGNDLYVVGRGKNIEKDADPRQSLIQKVNTGTMSVTNLVSAYDLESSGGYIEALALTEAGDAFVVTHKPSADKTEVKYYLLKGLNPTSAQKLMTLSGDFSSLRYDNVSKLFWVSNATGKTDKGAQLYAFDSAGKRAASLNTSELGGTPNSLTIAKGSDGSSVDSNASTGSGGCSTGATLPFIMLLPLGYCLRKRGKKVNFGTLPPLPWDHSPDKSLKHAGKGDE